MLWNVQSDKVRRKIRNDTWKSTDFILLKEKYRSWKKTSTLKQIDDFYSSCRRQNTRKTVIHSAWCLLKYFQKGLQKVLENSLNQGKGVFDRKNWRDSKQLRQRLYRNPVNSDKSSNKKSKEAKRKRLKRTIKQLKWRYESRNWLIWWLKKQNVGS